MKNIVKLKHYYAPWELEQEVARFVEYYNNHRYHESSGNVTPADKYHVRADQITSQGERIKRETLKLRRKENLSQPAGVS
jgi:putative transposase